MEQRSQLIIPDKMRDFVQKLPDDLKKRLSFFDLDRICRIFHDREEALLFERDQARFIAAGIRAEAGWQATWNLPWEKPKEADDR